MFTPDLIFTPNSSGPSHVSLGSRRVCRASPPFKPGPTPEIGESTRDTFFDRPISRMPSAGYEVLTKVTVGQKFLDLVGRGNRWGVPELALRSPVGTRTRAR